MPEIKDEEKVEKIEKDEDVVEEEEEKEEEKPEEEEEDIDVEKITPEVRKERKEKAQSEEDDDEIDPDDQKMISKVVDEKVGGVVRDLENKIEVSNFLRSKPEFVKYEQVMLKYMSHPDYANIPVHNIAAIVASKDMMKLGAAKEREAQKKVNESKNPGNQVRKVEPDTKDWSTASKEDFEAQKAKIFNRN